MGLILGREFKMTKTVFNGSPCKRSYETKMAYYRVYQPKIKDNPNFCRSYVFASRLGVSPVSVLISGEPSWFYRSKESLEKDLELNDVTKHCQKTLWEF